VHLLCQLLRPIRQEPAKPSIHRIASHCNASQSPNEARPNQTKPNQTCSSSNSSNVLPSPSHPNHHPHPRILEKALLHSLLRLPIPPLPSFDQPHPIHHPSTVIWIVYIKNQFNRTRRARSVMEHQQNQPPPQGGVPGPTGRRLHSAHRRSPSELTPLMSMFSSPGSMCHFSSTVVLASLSS
jgi:hypothetical protein